MQIVSIELKEAIKKKPEHFANAKNPRTLHPYNYKIVAVFKVTWEFKERLRNGDEDTYEKLREMARKRGHYGQFLVSEILPGPGRYGFGKGGGMPTLCTLEVEPEESW